MVPSANIGNLGRQQGEVTSFDWKWYYSVSGLAIWLALILAFVIPKANHNIRILLILVPLAIVNLLWWIFIRFAGMNSTDAQEFSIVFNSMAVSVMVLWLIANLLASFGGAIRFLLSFGTIVIVAGLGTLSYSTELSKETAMFLALFIFMALTMLISITLSRRFCAGKYRPVRFMLWLAFCTLLVSMFATFGFIITGSIIMSERLEFSVVMLVFVLAGLVFGLCLYVLNLPFMILGFAHPFFRERLCASLGLKPISITPKPANVTR